MKDPKFCVDDIRSISTAGAGLLKWVFAMVNYYRSATAMLCTCQIHSSNAGWHSVRPRVDHSQSTHGLTESVVIPLWIDRMRYYAHAKLTSASRCRITFTKPAPASNTVAWFPAVWPGLSTQSAKRWLSQKRTCVWPRRSWPRSRSVLNAA